MNSETEKLKSLFRDSVADGSFRKAVFSKPVHKVDDAAVRVDVRPVMIRGETLFQFTSRVGTQETHCNFAAERAIQEMQKSAGKLFRDIRLQTANAEWLARHNRKGVCSLKRSSGTDDDPEAAMEHDRSRRYLIPDGTSCPFLIATGIMSDSGHVRAKHFRKFRQINRYVEFIRDIVHHLPGEGTIRVVDFGCGKSYLTFATHYFLTEILKRDVLITGLDRRPDVIATCNAVVADLKLAGINFEEGDIAGYQPESQVHLAISLHACDTATDDALASAVAWNADVILAVPCCQHELAALMSKDRLPLFSAHGILHERFASLATDAVRADLLTRMGYDTQVMEFIDMEHTAKNLLIRALKRRNVSTNPPAQDNRRQMTGFSEQLGVPSLRLQKKLEEYGLLDSQMAEAAAQDSAE